MQSSVLKLLFFWFGKAAAAGWQPAIVGDYRWTALIAYVDGYAVNVDFPNSTEPYIFRVFRHSNQPSETFWIGGDMAVGNRFAVPISLAPNGTISLQQEIFLTEYTCSFAFLPDNCQTGGEEFRAFESKVIPIIAGARTLFSFRNQRVILEGDLGRVEAERDETLTPNYKPYTYASDVSMSPALFPAFSPVACLWVAGLIALLYP